MPVTSWRLGLSEIDPEATPGVNGHGVTELEGSGPGEGRELPVTPLPIAEGVGFRKRQEHLSTKYQASKGEK